MTNDTQMLSPVRAGDFDDFFAAVMEKAVGEKASPYPWQKRLVETVLRSGWPDALGLPTGTGKTTVLSVGVFLLALEAGSALTERKTGLRLFYVVDRRLIVDQAEQLATRLAEAINTADEKGSDVLGRMKRALLAYGAEKALDVIKLRGGLYGRLPWVREPNQPTIVLTTVDQIGSRLLFRGYGVGSRQWPVHAALTAFDAIYFLDEVHLSWPFAETLDGLRRHLAREPLVQAGLPPLRTVIMSGTLPDDQESRRDVFLLGEDDWADLRLKRRLEAKRFVRLVERRLTAQLAAIDGQTSTDGQTPTGGQREDENGLTSTFDDEEAHLEGEERLSEAQTVEGRAETSAGGASGGKEIGLRHGKEDRRTVEEVAKFLAEEAMELLREVDGPVAVIANRVATARHVFEELKKFWASEAGNARGEEVTEALLLLTGRVRPFDRKRLHERLFSPRGLPRIVVATQTIEVGVDVSFAGMVSEAAPCDALLQRLGRLNRDGRYDERKPRCIVVVPKGKTYKPYPYTEEDVLACLQALSSLPEAE